LVSPRKHWISWSHCGKLLCASIGYVSSTEKQTDAAPGIFPQQRFLMNLKPLVSLLLFAAASVYAAGDRARNVILFLGDAGGIPTLNVAGIYAHDKPQSLFIQNMPHLALSDTSSLDAWVTDSAAGMTAIVTGQKTNNGMLSELPEPAGQPLKTILEYAEEKGLATGVVTNRPVWDATPAACYAHVPARKQMTEIFSQVFAPRYGDGVDVLIGADKKKLFAASEQAGLNVEAALHKAGYTSFDTPSALTSDVSRAVSIYDGGDFTPAPVIDTVMEILGRNPRGFFLMVEWDMHTDNIKKGLDRAIVMDELIRHVAAQASPDTLIIYAADHSFDLRLRGGERSSPMASQIDAGGAGASSAKPVLAMEHSHTGEEILVTAQGPGAERLHGFIPNTKIFDIMMSAYGWETSP
jgi:alkaline phosphatase